MRRLICATCGEDITESDSLIYNGRIGRAWVWHGRCWLDAGGAAAGVLPTGLESRKPPHAQDGAHEEALAER